MNALSIDSMKTFNITERVEVNPINARGRAFFANVLLCFICGNVALDFATGLLGLSSISQVLRMCLFAFLLYVELRLDKAGFCLLFSATTAIITQSALTQLFFREGLVLSSLLYDVGMGIKLLLVFSIYLAANSLIQCGALTVKRIRKAISIAAIYVPILYLSSVAFGIGESSYWDGSGYKSVFSSLNSVNVAMIVLFAFSTDAFLHQKKKNWFIPMSLNLISLMMLGTKAGYVFAFIILMYYLAIPPETRSRNIFIGSLILILLLFAFDNIPFLNDLLSKVSTRQTYLFENRSLIDFITSGRTWMLAEAAELFSSRANHLAVFFGDGYYVFHHELAEASGYLSTASVRPIEFDWADLFFSYGAPVSLLIYLFLFKKLHAAWRARKQNRFQFIALLSLLAFSSIGGHVLFEAISSMTLGSVLACISEDNNDEQQI